MRGKASAGAKSRVGADSLMERLAALEREGAGQGRKRSSGRSLAVKRRRGLFRTSFGVGLAGSGIAGCIGLLVLVVVQPERTGMDGAFFAEALASIVPGLPGFVASKPDARPANVPRLAANPPLEIALQRSQRAMAPLPLEITGIKDPDTAVVWLRDVPERAWLSRGERRDEHTWTLRVNELENLHLTLNEGAPDVFNLTIEIASAGGTPSAQTTARVRLLDEFSSSAGTGRQVVATSPGAPAISQAIEAGGSSEPIHAKTRTSATAGDVAPQIAAQRVQPRVQRPEGMSALGALPRDPASESRVEGRQVWWKMPAPAWSPFANGGQ
jgi:hypothetical protein